MTTLSAVIDPKETEMNFEKYQGELLALHDYLNQFAGISNQDLIRFNISGHLAIIQKCLSSICAKSARNETSRPKVRYPYRNNFENSMCIPQKEKDWSRLREEAKQAIELARQLVTTLAIIRTLILKFDPCGEVPQDIRKMNADLENILRQLTCDMEI